ncbi:ABC transporter substrate-binding protein [Rhodobacteraceae bacterium]|nr:ABC transporter substrate-binding protein [Paracoccaceae bacterium]
MCGLALIGMALAGFGTAALAESAPARVLSIGGSATEIAYALGAGDRLVARDTTSSYPAAATQLPDVGYMRALSPEGVLSVGPDLIMMEDGAGPPEALDVIEAAGVTLAHIPGGHDAAAVAAKVRAVGHALGVDAQADALAHTLQADITAAREAANADNGPKPKVLFLLSNTGGRLTGGGAGTGAAAMIELAGGQNAIPSVRGYKALSDEAIATAAPDVVLVMDRGDGGVSEGAMTGDGYPDHPALAQTPAGQNGRLVRMGGLYLLGFGPRTPAAIRDLHRALYAGAP